MKRRYAFRWVTHALMRKHYPYQSWASREAFLSCEVHGGDPYHACFMSSRRTLAIPSRNQRCVFRYIALHVSTKKVSKSQILVCFSVVESMVPNSSCGIGGKGNPRPQGGGATAGGFRSHPGAAPLLAY